MCWKSSSPMAVSWSKALAIPTWLFLDSATDGVKACLELVQTTLPGMGMEFRASTTGDVQQLENDYFGNSDYFGEPVNRLRAHPITPAREVWFADRTRRCMIPVRWAWETVGLHSFKGVPQRRGLSSCIGQSVLYTSRVKSRNRYRSVYDHSWR